MSGLENAKAPESNADASGLAELKAQLAEGAGPLTSKRIPQRQTYKRKVLKLVQLR
jgi:hypothetical protein